MTDPVPDRHGAHLAVLLDEVVELAGQAPDLTDTELRDRLLALACKVMTLPRQQTPTTEGTERP